MKTLQVRTHMPQEFIDITELVGKVVTEEGVREGLCVVFVPHTSAGVTVQEHEDPAVREDILMELGKFVPQVDKYKHVEGNSAAHIKSALMGASVSIPVSAGRLALGQWQGVFLCEFDGPRQRTVQVQVMAAK